MLGSYFENPHTGFAWNRMAFYEDSNDELAAPDWPTPPGCGRLYPHGRGGPA